jgi:hypothetical protein
VVLLEFSPAVLEFSPAVLAPSFEAYCGWRKMWPAANLERPRAALG